MKKIFETPELSITKFDVKDIITTSGDDKNFEGETDRINADIASTSILFSGLYE